MAAQVCTQADIYYKGKSSLYPMRGNECLGPLLGQMHTIEKADLYVLKAPGQAAHGTISIENIDMAAYVALLRCIGFHMELADTEAEYNPSIVYWRGGSGPATKDPKYMRIRVMMGEMGAIANILALHSIRYAYSRWSSSHSQDGVQLGHTIIPHFLRLAEGCTDGPALMNLWLLLNSALPIQTHTFSHGSFFGPLVEETLDKLLHEPEHHLYSSFNSMRLPRLQARIAKHAVKRVLSDTQVAQYDKYYGAGRWETHDYHDYKVVAELLAKNASLDDLVACYKEHTENAALYQTL